MRDLLSRLQNMRLVGFLLVLSLVGYHFSARAVQSYFPAYLLTVAVLLSPSSYRQLPILLKASPIAVLSLVYLIYVAVSGLWATGGAFVVAKNQGYAVMVGCFLLAIVQTAQRAQFKPWLLLLVVVLGSASAYLGLGNYLEDRQSLSNTRLKETMIPVSRCQVPVEKWRDPVDGLTQLQCRELARQNEERADYTYWRLEGHGRLSHPVIGSLHVALCLCISVAFLSYQIPGTRKLLILANCLMLSAYLYLSGSIGVLIGLTIVSLFLGTRSLDSKPRVVLWAGIVGIAGLALFLALDFLTFSPRGLSFRDVIWQEVVALLLQGNRLIHGFGAGSSFTLPLVSGEIAQHPHSIYFATIYQGGLIGLVLVLLLITRCCWLVFARHSPYFNVLGSAWLYAISTLAVDGNTIVSKFDHMWILVWLPVALLIHEEASAARSTD